MKHLIKIIFIYCVYSSAQDGSLDLSFGDNGIITTNIVQGETSEANSLAILPDGKFIILSNFTDAGNADIALYRFNQDGSVDNSFGGNGKIIYQMNTGYEYGDSMAVQEDGKLIIAGNIFINSQYDIVILRINTDGTLDNSFGNNGKVILPISVENDDKVRSLLILNDNKILFAGLSNNGTDDDILLFKLLSNGNLDNSFGTNGIVIKDISNDDDVLYTVKTQDNGKIVVGGASEGPQFSQFLLSRFNANGTQDFTFGVNGVVTTPMGDFDAFGYDMDIIDNEKILLAGKSRTASDTDFAIAQYNQNGTLDSGFGNNGKINTDFENTFDSASTLIIQPDNKILLLGYTGSQSAWDFALARYNQDGSLDTTFGNNGKVNTNIGVTSDFINDGKLQSEGKILVAGKAWNGSRYEIAIAQYFSGLVLGTVDFIKKEKVFISPNPVINETKLNYFIKNNEQLSINLFNSQGKLVRSFIEKENRDSGYHTETLNFENLVSGYYILKIDNGGRSLGVKILKN